jgi:hypothetical protein
VGENCVAQYGLGNAAEHRRLDTAIGSLTGDILYVDDGAHFGRW